MAIGVLALTIGAICIARWWMEFDVLPGQINLFEEEE